MWKPVSLALGNTHIFVEVWNCYVKYTAPGEMLSIGHEPFDASQIHNGESDRTPQNWDIV